MLLEEEVVMSGITSMQMNDLIRRINNSGVFIVNNSGHVMVVKHLPSHPRGANDYLPVGFVDKNRAFLVNLDKKFPRDYHTQLRSIYIENS